ncbi:hypothetical protein PGB90_010207 [Kerria lacca]
MYKDCCINSSYKNVSNSSSVFTCAEISKNGYMIKNHTTCINTKYKRKCSNSSNYIEQVRNFKLKVPVISLSSGITYGNAFCAQCDNVTDFQFWNVNLTCETVKEILTVSNDSLKLYFSNRSDLNDKLKFDNKVSRLWNINIENRTEKCTLLPLLPQQLRNSSRRCRPKIIDNCPSNWSFANITDKCRDYQSIVSDISGKVYRNAYCAICNGVNSTDLLCIRMRNNLKRGMNITQSFNTSTTVGKNLTNTTKSIPNKKRTFIYLQMNLDCSEVLELINFTKINAETIHYSTFNRTYIRNELVINGNSIKMCKNNDVESNNYEVVDDGLLIWFCDLLTIFGFIVSIFLLLLHLWEFYLPDASNSMNQKILTSYSFSLLLANIGILSANILSSNVLLYFSEIFSYFGFMTSFLWITCMAFDLTCVVWTLGNNSATLIERFESPFKFSVYSIISWTLPTILTIVLIFVNENNSTNELLLGYSSIENDRILQLFFVLPLTTTISVNLAFYACSVYAVSVEPEIFVNLLTKREIEFKFHTGFVVTTDAMWSIALLNYYLSSYFLKILFSTLNIFLAFLVYVNSPVQNKTSKKVKEFVKNRYSRC